MAELEVVPKSIAQKAGMGRRGKGAGFSAPLDSRPMSDKRTRFRPWRWALLLLAVLVTVLAVVPAPPRQMDLGWDKLNHVAAFAALAVCAVFGWQSSRAARLSVLLSLLALGAAIELLQLQVPNRSGEWTDLGADAIGIGLGALLAVFWLRRRKEQQ
jgi:VanZ family protein